MRKQIEQRLQELRNEYEAGQKILSELGARQVNMQEAMLRISGAIQALEELINAEQKPDTNNGHVPGHSTEPSISANMEQSTSL